MPMHESTSPAAERTAVRDCTVSQPFEAIRRHREEVVTLSANSIGRHRTLSPPAWPGRRVIAISNKAPGCRTWYALLAAPAPVRGTSPTPRGRSSRRGVVPRGAAQKGTLMLSRDHRMLDAVTMFALGAVVSWWLLEATGGGWFTFLLLVIGALLDRQLRAGEEWKETDRDRAVRAAVRDRFIRRRRGDE